MKIKISEDFSEIPGARYYEDGDYSGQQFFEEVLRPKFLEVLKSNQKLIVNFDDCYGFASSFLSESFGKLSEEFGAKDVLNKIEIESEQDPLLPKHVISIINNPGKR